MCIALVFTKGWERMRPLGWATLLVPFLTNLIVWTNPIHHLQYRVFSVVKSEIVFGPYIYLSGIYTYFCLVTGIVLMISFAIKNDSRLYLKQCILFSVGGIVPLVVSSIATFGPPDIPITATPLSFVATIVCNGIAIYQLHLLDIKPIATQHILDWITDCYLVLSDEGLVITYNTVSYTHLPRTPQLYAAMLGAMRAGVPYLLLSCDLPAGRIRQILSQSGAQAVLSTPQILARLGVDPAPIACVDMENLPESQAPARAVPPDALAYVVYTSGSTGVPKGVEISRWSLLNLSQAMQAVYGAGAVLSVCNVGFDAFVLESAAAMLDGRTVVLPREEEEESPQKLADLIRSFGVGFLSLTPSPVSYTHLSRKKQKNFSTVTGMALVTCLTALCVWSVSSLHSSALRRLLSL